MTIYRACINSQAFNNNIRPIKAYNHQLSRYNKINYGMIVYIKESLVILATQLSIIMKHINWLSHMYTTVHVLAKLASTIMQSITMTTSMHGLAADIHTCVWSCITSSIKLNCPVTANCYSSKITVHGAKIMTYVLYHIRKPMIIIVMTMTRSMIVIPNPILSLAVKVSLLS